MEASEKIYAIVKTMPMEQVNEVLDFIEFLQQKPQSISEIASPANKIPPGTLTGLRGIANGTSTPLTDKEIEEDYTNYRAKVSVVKILIDTNIVLDLILNREPFVESALILFELIEITKIQGFIAATIITNIFYIVRKAKGRQQAIEAITRLSTGLVICSVDSLVVRRALECNLKDFEDGLQLACAEINQLNAIVTHDISDFLGVDLSILSIAELQQLIK